MSASSWNSPAASITDLRHSPQPPSLSLHLPSFPQLLFPSSPAPRFQPPTEASPNPEPAEPRDDTVVSGYVLASACQSTPIKSLRVVWEVSYQTRAFNTDDWAPKASFVARELEVCASAEVIDTGQDDEQWLDSGQTRFDFSLILPATLPPSTITPLSKVVHTVYASIIAPPLPTHSRRSSMHVSSPPYSPKASSRELAAERRRKSSSSNRSRSGPRPSLHHFLPDLTSPLGMKTREGSDRDSDCYSDCSDDSMSSCELAVDESDLPGGPGHGRGLMLDGTDAEASMHVEQKRGSFDFFGLSKMSSRGRSVRSASSSTRELALSPPAMSPPTLLHSLLRIGSSGGKSPESVSRGTSIARQPLAVQPTSFNEAMRSMSDRASCPSACLPSLALAQTEVQVQSLTPLRGMLPSLEWVCEELLPGIGPISLHVGSSLAALGSAINFHMHIAALQPAITVHFLTISLVQYHARSGTPVDLSAATEYLLHKAGTLHRHGRNGRPTQGGYLWRGAIGMALEAAEAPRPPAPKRGKNKAKTAPPPVILSTAETGPSLSSTDKALDINLPLRLPSPVVGAIPGTPAAAVLPAGTERTLHKLKVDVYFSVMGEDEQGRPYPGSGGGDSGLGMQRMEGGLRKCVIQRNVELGPCSATPDNIILPPYDLDHALLTLNERPSVSKKWVPLDDPKDIRLMPKTTAPIMDPSHHLVTERVCGVTGETSVQSCLCYWTAEALERHVGAFTYAGCGCCVASLVKVG